MTYFVLCTFDLYDATATNYDDVYTKLAEIGLNSTINSKQGNAIDLPNTTVAGKFEGISCAYVRDEVSKKVKGIFQVVGVKSKSFTIVADGYAWTQTTT
ncbi:hypothetical protein JCM19239_2672 [Vibrio variabilis]|uniref:Phage protein n=1 Tax=Vibrio variabilis TaxID=990271 RepID=A0ABQ0JNI7_9VIBR|nr:hypothetical protein JCM19239_2672 [Vibrio variabilis]